MVQIIKVEKETTYGRTRFTIWIKEQLPMHEILKIVGSSVFGGGCGYYGYDEYSIDGYKVDGHRYEGYYYTD